MTAPSFAAPIAVIGDSHVAALVAPLREALSRHFYGIHTVKAVSRSGWTTGRFEREGDVAGTLRAMGPLSLVVIVLGTNDWGITADDAYKRSVAAVARAALASGQPVVWVGPPAAPSPRIAAGVGRAARLQQEILGYPMWRDGRPMTASAPFRDDGVHLTPAGYAQWADAIAQILPVEGARKQAPPPPITPPPPAPPAPSDRWRIAAGLAIGAAVVGAVGYALWQWRRD